MNARMRSRMPPPPPMPRDDVPRSEVSRNDGSRMIPFDQSFQFRLEGEAQKVHRATVTISVEASFTAVSIGYGVVPEVSPVTFGFEPAIFTKDERSPTLRNISFADVIRSLQNTLTLAPDSRNDVPILEAALRNGIKLNADFATLALQGGGNANLGDGLSQVFQVVSPPPINVQFLYALFDEGSGREFQSAPLLNIAGLGAADGKRPFRYFAQPIRFAPLATIRMDIIELSDVRGQLHVSLHGYKVIGQSDAAPSRDRVRRRRTR